MPQNIVDLRKTSGETTIILQDDKESRPKGGGKILEWSAYEHPPVKRGPYWFFLPGGAALLFIIVGIIAKNYFFIALIVLAFSVLMIYMKRAPRRLNFSITPEGVRVENKIYDFASLKSFWIFEKRAPRELSLETDGALTPYVRIPLGDLESEEARSYLRGFLKEEEHKELFSDGVARSLGL